MRIYNAVSCQLLSTLLAPRTPSPWPNNSVTALLINPANSLQIIVGSADGYIRIWDYLEGNLLRSLDIGAPVTHVAAHSSWSGYLFIATASRGYAAKAQDQQNKPGTGRLGSR